MKFSLFLLFLIQFGASAAKIPENFKKQLDSISSLAETQEKVQLLNDLAWQTKYIDLEFTSGIVADAIIISEKNQFHSEAGMTYKLAGIIADEKGLYTESIQQYQLAIKSYEKINDEMGIAKCEGNIGMVYRKIKKYGEAFKYFKKANQTFEKNEFYYGVMLISSNLGISYLELNKLDSSYLYFKQSEAVMNEIGANDPSIKGNLGLVYYKMDSLEIAEKYLLEAAEAYRNYLPSDYRIKIWYQNLGSLYQDLEQYDKSKEYFLKALDYTEDYYNREATYLLRGLANLNRTTGDYRASTYFYRILQNVTDSIYSIENLAQINEMEEKYESEKKELEIIALDKENKLEVAKRASEENKVFYFTIGSILLGVLLIFVVYGLVIKSKDNKKIKEKNNLIESQKSSLELKNLEITSSIEYAKRIQSAILPPLKLVKSYFENSFVLYKPKDIVAGDFYWFEASDDHVIFAAADCTGHGVPGAMVSVVCHNALNRSFKEFGLTEPGDILDKTREIVIEQFDNSEEAVKDGMDIALCSYSIKDKILKYSGANNPLWLVRKGELEIIEIKANKQPIGSFHMNSHFDTHEIKLEKGDCLYIFSDGYADQFGGKSGKKFKSKSLKKLILSIQDKSMSEQREEMDSFFERWMGELEQLDDVCVIGVKFDDF